MKADSKQTVQLVLLIAGLVGGGTGVSKVAADVADIRERVARIEARLDYAAAVAAYPNP